MKDYLKEGNVIVLGAGAKVYAMIPEMFAYANTKLSTKLTQTETVIGQKYTNEETIANDINEVVDDLSERIADLLKRKGVIKSDKEIKEFVNSGVPAIGTRVFTVPEGQYLVTKTKFTGGGTGMGPHDVFPDGHHVTCKKLGFNGKFVEDGLEINFYQSGSFTAMIYPEDLKVERQMKMSYS
jgi:hypothetical protein